MWGAALSLIGGGISKAWIYLAIAVAVLAAVASVLLGARQAGRNAERVDNLKKALANENERKRIDVDVSGASDAELGKLRDKWTRG